MKKVCILDYGLGNIKSLYNALKKIGVSPFFFSENNNDKKNFDVVFIPGVGSFSKASELLLDDRYKNFINNTLANSYIFGICLGMQILFSSGEENGKHSGLDIIKGKVKILEKKNNKLILPMVGYQPVSFLNNKHNFLSNFNNEKFYFVHSYAAFPENNDSLIGKTKSQDVEYCAAVLSNKVLGTQFHPEKSGKIGLEFINNFINAI